ncbi:MAG: CBS domain-containing protein [Evtepia gabavorous]
MRDIMNPHVVSIDPTESAALAARLLARHNVGSLPVCGSGGQLQGMVTDRDIVLRCVAAEEDPGRCRCAASCPGGPPLSPRRTTCARPPA